MKMLRTGNSKAIFHLFIITLFLLLHPVVIAQKKSIHGYGVQTYEQAKDKKWTKDWFKNSNRSTPAPSSGSSSGSGSGYIFYESKKDREKRNLREEYERIEQWRDSEQRFKESTKAYHEERKQALNRILRTRTIGGVEYELDETPQKLFGGQDMEIVRYQGKLGVLKNGKLVQPFEFDWIGHFFEGRSLVSKNRKYGYLDSTALLTIPLEYDKAGNFSYNTRLAYVSVNGKWGFINRQNEEVVKLKYDTVSSFRYTLIHKGKAVSASKVKLNNKWGFINETGSEIIPVKWDRFDDFDLYNMARVQLNYKTGFIDTKGREIIPVKYDSIGKFESLGQYLAKVKLNNKTGS